MAIRRIAVEEAFVTPEIMAQWHVVLAGRNVEPGFAKMGESILAQTPANKALDDRLLDIGAGRIAHMDSLGVDVHVLSLTAPGVQVFDAVRFMDGAEVTEDERRQIYESNAVRYFKLKV